VNQGRASERLTPDEGVKRYLAMSNADTDLPLAQKPRKQHKPREPIFTNLTITSRSGHRNVAECGEAVTFEVEAENFEDLNNLTCGIALHNERGHRVLFLHTLYHSGFSVAGSRRARFTCDVPALPLVPGSYYVELVMADGYQIIEQVERAEKLDVVYANLLGTGKLPKKGQGYFVLPCAWTHEQG